MEIKNVTYHKRCLECGYSTGNQHFILWNGVEQFFKSDGSLIDEIDAVGLIRDFHNDTDIKCENCGTVSFFEFWDIAIGNSPYHEKKKAQLVGVSIIGGKQKNMNTRFSSSGTSIGSVDWGCTVLLQKVSELKENSFTPSDTGWFRFIVAMTDNEPYYEIAEFKHRGCAKEAIEKIIQTVMERNNAKLPIN